MIYVVTGPSGGGKTTFISILLEHLDEVKMIDVDVSTHSKRKYKNTPGRKLVSKAYINSRCYSVVNSYDGNQYGYTIPADVESFLYVLDYPGEYPDCIEFSDCQWQGILILPPSEHELVIRLTKANRESRIQSAINEYRECLDDIASGRIDDSWIIIINDTIATSLCCVTAIKERAKSAPYYGAT